jgi:predicted aldo/keto reductase-like oxidoreductase
MSLARLAELAERAGGKNHRFRFIQLPLNLGMAEAYTIKREPVAGDMKSTLEAAAALGVTVVASASLMQSRLAHDLPAEIRARLPGPLTDAQCALQFTRSTPGVAVALVGMGKAVHVAENLGIASFPPATSEQYLSLFQ